MSRSSSFSTSNRGKLDVALRKISVANAFKKAQAGGDDWPGPERRHSLDIGRNNSETGSAFFSQDSSSFYTDGEEHYSNGQLDINNMPPMVRMPRGPFYGLYGTYEEVVDLMQNGTVADDSTKWMLSQASSEQVVFVAHLGLGACCAVDLVAVHMPNGTRLIAAAKSAFLPPSDVRLRSVIKEADLLKRCADCPFIMPLFAVFQEVPAASADCAAWPDSPQQSPHCSRGQLELDPHQFAGMAAACNGGGGGMLQMRASTGSVGGWDGSEGGSGASLERQASFQSPSGARGGSFVFPSSPRPGGGGGLGSGMSSSIGSPFGIHGYCSMGMTDMYNSMFAAEPGRRAGGSFTGDAPPGDLSSSGSVLVTLLLGWARGSDLRKLAQLLLARSLAHQPSRETGGHPAVATLPLLMSEATVRFYAACLALALEHLHHRLGVVHRDLKLANLLLAHNGYLTLGDLGCAADVEPGHCLTARVGSPGHMAPEVSLRDPAGYGLSADMWSVGACLYNMATGQLPAGIAGPPNKAWRPTLSRAMSHEFQNLLSRLLSTSPGDRPTPQEMMGHPWFRSINWQALRAQRLPAPCDVPWQELLWKPKHPNHT